LHTGHKYQLRVFWVERTNLVKTICAATIFSIIFFLIFITIFPLQSNDDAEWRNMANQEYNTSYRSYLRLILPFIVWNNLLWVAFWVILFGFIFPLVLAWWTDNWLAVPFYFCCTNFFYAIMGAGLYAQGMTTLLFILFLASKNRVLKTSILLVAIFVHAQAIYLFGLAIILLLIVHFSKKVALFCSPVFYKSAILTEKLNGVVGEWGLTLRDIGSFFVKGCPLPFLYKAFKHWFEKKEWFYFLFFLCLWLAAWFVQDRVLFTFFPLMVVGFTKGFEDSRHKRFWLALVILWGVFQFEQFAFLRVFC
jgi:hypothetical protein